MGYLREKDFKLPEDVIKDYPDYKLFQLMWELIGGFEQEGAKVQDLKYVLMVIRGFRDPSLEVDEPIDEEKQGLARFFF